MFCLGFSGGGGALLMQQHPIYYNIYYQLMIKLWYLSSSEWIVLVRWDLAACIIYVFIFCSVCFFKLYYFFILSYVSWRCWFYFLSFSNRYNLCDWRIRSHNSFYFFYLFFLVLESFSINFWCSEGDYGSICEFFLTF